MTEQQPDYKRKWVVPKRKRGGVEKIHLMNTNDEAFCGRHITPDPKKILNFDDYCPLDHEDKVCPKCLEWWNSIRPGKFGKKKAAQSSSITPSSLDPLPVHQTPHNST